MKKSAWKWHKVLRSLKITCLFIWLSHILWTTYWTHFQTAAKWGTRAEKTIVETINLMEWIPKNTSSDMIQPDITWII